MNVLRNWGGGIYQHDEFYSIADELGYSVTVKMSAYINKTHKKAKECIFRGGFKGGVGFGFGESKRKKKLKDFEYGRNKSKRSQYIFYLVTLLVFLVKHSVRFQFSHYNILEACLCNTKMLHVATPL